jgi:hypothetical protein
MQDGKHDQKSLGERINKDLFEAFQKLAAKAIPKLEQYLKQQDIKEDKREANEAIELLSYFKEIPDNKIPIYMKIAHIQIIMRDLNINQPKSSALNSLFFEGDASIANEYKAIEKVLFLKSQIDAAEKIKKSADEYLEKNRFVFRTQKEADAKKLSLLATQVLQDPGDVKKFKNLVDFSENVSEKNLALYKALDTMLASPFAMLKIVREQIEQKDKEIDEEKKHEEKPDFIPQPFEKDLDDIEIKNNYEDDEQPGLNVGEPDLDHSIHGEPANLEGIESKVGEQPEFYDQEPGLEIKHKDDSLKQSGLMLANQVISITEQYLEQYSESRLQTMGFFNRHLFNRHTNHPLAKTLLSMAKELRESSPDKFNDCLATLILKISAITPNTFARNGTLYNALFNGKGPLMPEGDNGFPQRTIQGITRKINAQDEDQSWKALGEKLTHLKQGAKLQR